MTENLCKGGKEKVEKGEKALYAVKEKVLHNPSTASGPKDILRTMIGKDNKPTLKTESEPVLKKFLGKKD
jgi:hypothetical protein